MLRQLVLIDKGLLNPGSAVERPGQRTAELLERQLERKKWSTLDTMKVFKCFYTAESSKRKYQQRTLSTQTPTSTSRDSQTNAESL